MREVLVASIPKNGREELRITLCEFKGVPLANLRVWYEPQGGGERRPGKDGLAVRIGNLPELVAALQRAQEEAQSQGLLPSGEGGAK